MKSNESERGNVVIELTLAVALFGTLLMPAVDAIAHLATAYRLADTAAMTVARTWTVTESGARAVVVSAVRSRMVQNSSLPMRMTLTCLPSCGAAATSVSVTAFVQSGVLGEIRSTYTLERDAYGQ